MVKGKGKPDFEQEDVLQAVIVADRFDNRFQPLSEDIPLALFPVVNKPLLSYILNFLVSEGVQQIYVYCCHRFSQIKEFIANSEWGSKSSLCTVTPMVSCDFTSMGDVLRDIDQKALFETDFFLVSGDLICNMSLKQAWREHRERRAKDKNKPLMTVMLRDCSPTHETRSSEDDIVVAIDSTTQQVLHYQTSNPSSKSKFEFPLKTFLQNGCLNFDLRYDLVNAGIAVCSPQVPQLFTDNFDYQTKEDFIRGILVNEEFLGNQIHVHTVKKHFATRISTLHMYDTVSKALISRWVYPYVPDGNFETPERARPSKEKKDKTRPPSPELYRHLRRNVYMGNIKSIGKDSLIEENSVVGHGTTIGDNCRIINTVIGSDCDIGNGVVIRDSYLWSGVVVRDNCSIEKSLLSNHSTVHESTTLKPGCILANNVEIGPNVTLNEGTVIHIEVENDTFAEGEPKARQEKNPSVVGNKGRGVLYSNVDDDDSDNEIDAIQEGIWGMSLSERDNIYPVYSDSDISDDEISSAADSDFGSEDDDPVTLFSKEVKDSLTRGIEENIKCENLILEINASKFAYNVTTQDVICNVTKAVFEIAHLRCNSGPFFPTLKKVLLYTCPVFINYNKSSQSQIECISEIERYCLRNKHAFDCLIKVLMLLYENDVLAEQVILHWHRKSLKIECYEGSELTPENLRLSVTKFIEWLQEADEESSEDES